MANYVPLGIYSIPAGLLHKASILYANADSIWYLQTVQRIGQYTYKAYVASSQELLTTTNEMMEITSEQLEQASLISSPKPASAYVAPASILPPNLRTHYSAAGLTFFEPVGSRNEGGGQPVRVVALGERLPNPQARSCLLDFGDEELKQAVLLTPELRKLSTADLRSVVEVYYTDSKIMIEQTADSSHTSVVTSDNEQVAKSVQSKLQGIPASIPLKEESNDNFDTTREISYQSSLECGKLSAKQLKALHIQMDEPLYCLLEQRLPIKTPEIVEEQEEIGPVYVSATTFDAVVNAAQARYEWRHTLTWYRKIALRSALAELARQQANEHLDVATRQTLQEQDWELRKILVNEYHNHYQRIQIIPTLDNLIQINGYYIYIYQTKDIQGSTMSA